MKANESARIIKVQIRVCICNNKEECENLSLLNYHVKYSENLIAVSVGSTSKVGVEAARGFQCGIALDVIGRELQHLERQVAPFLLVGAITCTHTHCGHGGRLNYGPMERRVPNTPSGTRCAQHIATLLA